MQEHFIFPLGTVLFPGARLPLKIFEQRYLEMTKTCLRDEKPFGVCLIREGAEVGAPAVPEAVGCLATIESWDMRELGMFNLIARGETRFRLHATRAAANGLITGSVELLPDEPDSSPDPACRELLRRIIEHVGEERFAAPIALADATWVSYRLAEVLPLDTRVKQQLLEDADARSRLERLRSVLIGEGLIGSTAN